MVKYEKYTTQSGNTFWKYYGHFGIDPKTGNKIKIRGQGLRSKAEAKLQYERKLEEIKNKKNISFEQIKFSQLTDEFLIYYKNSGIKQGTFKKFKEETERHIIPILGNIYIDQINVNDCQKAYDEIRAKRKDRSDGFR